MIISWLFLIWVSSSIPVMKQMLFPFYHMFLPSHFFSAPRVFCICEESGGKKFIQNCLQYLSCSKVWYKPFGREENNSQVIQVSLKINFFGLYKYSKEARKKTTTIHGIYYDTLYSLFQVKCVVWCGDFLLSYRRKSLLLKLYYMFFWTLNSDIPSWT